MSNRIEKVNSLIQEELSQIILKEVDFPKDVLVTITRVETIVNLSDARVYVSVMPENQRDQVFEILDRRIYDIQQCLNRRLNMRPIPKIEFRKEEKTQQAARVEELLEELKKK
jgi:ribosome-binding factor A